MPIHYRHFYREYRDVPIEPLRQAVERLEKAMTAYRREEIDLPRLRSIRRYHYEQWRDVSVVELFSKNSAIAKDAENLINRNEVNYGIICVFEVAACASWITASSREEKIQNFVVERLRANPDCDFPEYRYVSSLG
jgi:hypothetical protein